MAAAQAVPDPQMKSPAGAVLRYQRQFPYTLAEQEFCLIEDVVRPDGLKRPANGGNGTESAMMPTAFRDFQPGIRGACGKQASPGARRPRQMESAREHGRPEAAQRHRQPDVHFRQFPAQYVFAVAADHAARHRKERLSFAAGHGADGIQYGADGLAHRRFYEAAGVYENKTRPAYMPYAFDGHWQ